MNGINYWLYSLRQFGR